VIHDPDDAKQEIKQFIEDNPGCSIRDIIQSLNFDAELVIEIVDS
jgi:predicted transcriptional regulator